MEPPVSTDLLATIGNTPLVELRGLDLAHGTRIFAKLEGNNPGGSVKDRVARAICDDAAARGVLEPGATLIEASTGNTAISMAMVARQRGYDCHVVIPDGVVPSICDVLGRYDVPVTRVSSHAGMRGAFDAALELADKHGWYATRQFDNPLNVEAHYQTTGVELLAQLDRIDAFVAGIGTGGTIMGVARRLRERHPEVKIIGVEPRMGERLQGLRSMDDAWRPPLVDLDALNGRFLVGAADAIDLAARVIRTNGISMGMSGGATLYAALRMADRLPGGNIVIMASDAAWKYLPARPWRDAECGDTQLDDIHWW